MNVVRVLVLIAFCFSACDSSQEPGDSGPSPDVQTAADTAVVDEHPVDSPAFDIVDILPFDAPSADRSDPLGPDPGPADAAWEDGAWVPDDHEIILTDSMDVGEIETGDDISVYHPCEIRPVLFVHGINGTSAAWQTMAGRLEEDGWPPEYLYFFDAQDPSWGCNVDNAEAIKILVSTIMDETGSNRVDIVAHSMGTISSRYFIKNLGGTELVNTCVTLGGMHHGLLTPCLAPDFVRMFVCVWMELCQSGEFIAQLNADPATPGLLHWVSMYGTADETVPNESSHLEGAENIIFEGVEHDGDNGLPEVPEVYEEVRRVLQYPCW